VLDAICRRQANNYHRAAQHRPERVCAEVDLDLQPAPGPDSEEAYHARETARILGDLVRALPEERRVVVVAYQMEGAAMSDVARALNIPLNTAWNRLRLGRADLRAGWRRKVR
jgi:DNA-directed RNA polymerase specialized sigma24 family protein